MKRVVVFDWGGVLMRTVDYRPRHAWDRRLGLPAGSVEAVVHGIPAWAEAQRGETPLEAYWEAVRRELDLTAEELAALQRDFYSGDRLDENLVALLRGLKRDGMPLGLLSNNSLDLRETLTTLGLDGLFDACVISAEIGVMKPAPEAYHAILERLGVPSDEALLVDDSAENIEGARAVGMQAIHFTPGLNLRPLLEKWRKGLWQTRKNEG